MVISDFELIEVLGSTPINWKFRASITVTTKRLLRKPVVEKRPVYKTFGGFWYFSDSGENAPDEVRCLARLLEAKEGKELQHCETVK